MSEMKEKEAGPSPPPSPIIDDDAISGERQTGDKQSQLATVPQADVIPDGGYGWVCTICCALINAHTWGMNSSYGVFLAYYLKHNVFPGATRIEFAFVGGLSISTALLISPLATTSTRVFGTRTTLLIGVVLETASFIGSSFATKIWQLFLAQGVCFGFGLGFMFTASVGVVAQWFSRRRSLANGIAAAGSGFGGLVYSLSAQAAIEHLGLPWAFRVLGICAFVVNTTCALLMRDRNKAVGARHVAFDSQLLKRSEFWMLLGYGFFSMLAYVVLVFSLANYASVIGLTAQQGSVVGAILNLGQGLGRPPIGHFSDRIGRMNMAGLMTFLSGLFVLVIWINTKTYGVLIFYSLVGGTVAGTFWTTVAPVTAEVVGLSDLPAALSITWLSLAFSSFASEPIGLQIVTVNGGKYLGAQLFCGFMYMGAALCIVILRAWKIGQLEAVAASINVPTTELKPEQTAQIENQLESEAKKIKSPFISRIFRWQKV